MANSLNELEFFFFPLENYNLTASSTNSIFVGALEINGKVINLSYTTNSTARKLHEMVKLIDYDTVHFYAKTLFSICSAQQKELTYIHELNFDEIQKKAYIETSEGVIRIALDEFKRNDFPKDDVKIIFEGNLPSYRRHCIKAKLNLPLLMKNGDYVKFYNTITDIALTINKNEIIDFIIQHRHKLGKFIFKRSPLDAAKSSMGAFGLLENKADSLYGFLKTVPPIGELVEELIIYELRENPKDINSTLIGYARVVKNPVQIRKANLNLDQLFEEFKKKSKLLKNLYEISYIRLAKEYQDRGLGYLLLHQAIYDTLTNGEPDCRVKLHDQSGFKATKLYKSVGTYVNSEKQIQSDFNCKSLISKDYIYTLPKEK